MPIFLWEDSFWSWASQVVHHLSSYHLSSSALEVSQCFLFTVTKRTFHSTSSWDYWRIFAQVKYAHILYKRVYAQPSLEMSRWEPGANCISKCSSLLPEHKQLVRAQRGRFSVVFIMKTSEIKGHSKCKSFRSLLYLCVYRHGRIFCAWLWFFYCLRSQWIALQEQSCAVAPVISRLVHSIFCLEQVQCSFIKVLQSYMILIKGYSSMG